MSVSVVPSRIEALDLLRGFFIVVIIIDHLYLWPSALSIFTGQGDLWVTSAEGFVMISGLLVGYIRGYKERANSLSSVTKKLLKRALLLYAWLIIASIIYTSALWFIPLHGAPPWINIPRSDYATLLIDLITFHYAQTWVYFLYLYAIFLALSPLVIWALRKGWSVFAILSIIILSIIGQLAHIEWLEWLPVFFIPTIAGFYLPTIIGWWRSREQHDRTTIEAVFLTSGGIVLAASAISTFIIPTNPIAQAVNTLFSKEFVLYSWRVALALVLFISFIFLFTRFEPFIKKWLGWLLLPLGTRSLTAYIIHGVVILAITILLPVTENILINTLLGIIAILLTWGLLRIPIVQRALPR